jgi:hypothetical protein
MSKTKQYREDALAVIVEWHLQGQYDSIHAMELCLEVGGPGPWTLKRFEAVCDAVSRKANEVSIERSRRSRRAVTA